MKIKIIIQVYSQLLILISTLFFLLSQKVLCSESENQDVHLPLAMETNENEISIHITPRFFTPRQSFSDSLNLEMVQVEDRIQINGNLANQDNIADSSENYELKITLSREAVRSICENAGIDLNHREAEFEKFVNKRIFYGLLLGATTIILSETVNILGYSKPDLKKLILILSTAKEITGAGGLSFTIVTATDFTKKYFFNRNMKTKMQISQAHGVVAKFIRKDLQKMFPCGTMVSNFGALYIKKLRSQNTDQPNANILIDWVQNVVREANKLNDDFQVGSSKVTRMSYLKENTRFSGTGVLGIAIEGENNSSEPFCLLIFAGNDDLLNTSNHDSEVGFAAEPNLDATYDFRFLFSPESTYITLGNLEIRGLRIQTVQEFDHQFSQQIMGFSTQICNNSPEDDDQQQPINKIRVHEHPSSAFDRVLNPKVHTVRVVGGKFELLVITGNKLMYD